MARTLAEQAHLTYAQGNLEEATTLIIQAVDSVRRHSAKPDLPFFLLQYAEYLYDQQRYMEALSLVEETIAAAQTIQHYPLQMRANAQAAAVSKLVGKDKAAQEHTETSRYFLKQLDPYPDTLIGLLYLSRYHLLIHDIHMAVKISTFVANHQAAPAITRQHAEILQKETSAFSPDKDEAVEQLDWDELVSSISPNASV